LYQVRDPLPRAYVATSAEVASDSQLEAAFGADVLSGAHALVAAPGSAFASGKTRGSCTVSHYRADCIEATCTSPARGLGVFVEQWAPGWHATVDGAAAPVVRANFTSRGVPLAPGTHRVALRYEPPGLLAGLLISVLSCVLGSAAFVASGRTKHALNPAQARAERPSC
jgi:hypothetical protein